MARALPPPPGMRPMKPAPMQRPVKPPPPTRPAKPMNMNMRPKKGLAPSRGLMNKIGMGNRGY